MSPWILKSFLLYMVKIIQNHVTINKPVILLPLLLIRKLAPKRNQRSSDCWSLTELSHISLQQTHVPEYQYVWILLREVKLPYLEHEPGPNEKAFPLLTASEKSQDWLFTSIKHKSQHETQSEFCHHTDPIHIKREVSKLIKYKGKPSHADIEDAYLQAGSKTYELLFFKGKEILYFKSSFSTSL